MSYAVFLKNSYIWEMLDSRDMAQDAHGQSDCRIFKPTISLGKNDEKAWVFAYWCKFLEIKGRFKNIENGCDH